MERLVLLRIEPIPTAADKTLLTALGVDVTDGRRWEGMAAAGLLRVLASRTWDLPLSSLPITTTASGKPVFVHHPTRHFNLSHTRGGVLCGLADRPIGVDLEYPREIGDAVVRRCFSPAEQAWCGADATRRVPMWTRKEAALKWQGIGLAGMRRVDTAEDIWQSRLVTGQTDTHIWSACLENAGTLQAEEWTWQRFADYAATGIRS